MEDKWFPIFVSVWLMLVSLIAIAFEQYGRATIWLICGIGLTMFFIWEIQKNKLQEEYK